MNAQHSFLKKVLLFATLFSPLFLVAQNPNDLDNDGMLNDWEITYGLNPNDPVDAWLDNDGDFILNLHEFQLSTDPTDQNEPNTFDLSPTDDVLTTLEGLPTKSVLRLSTGTYFLNYRLGVFDDSKQMMIQGGWNESFTTYDPCQFPVTIDGSQGEDILDFDFFSDSSVVAVVLDGLNIVNSNGFAILVETSSDIDTTYFSMHNCKVYNNNADWFASAISIEDGLEKSHALLTVSNSQIVDNKGTGLDVAFFSSGSVFKMYNSLITNNETTPNDEGEPFGGNGLDIIILGDTLLRVDLFNNIIWGNATNDIDLIAGNRGFTFNSNYNNLGTFDLVGSLIYMPGDNDLSSDPLFQDPANGNYQLMVESPSKSKGTYLGLPSQVEGMVDMGPIICPLEVNSIFGKSVMVHPLKLFPTVNNGVFNISFDLPKQENLTWTLFQLNGSPVASGQIMGQTGNNDHFIQLDHSSISDGMHFFHLQGKHFIMNSSVFIQNN